MTVTRSLALFVLAAIAEIGGAWLIWQGVREHRGWVWIGAGVIALPGHTKPQVRDPRAVGRLCPSPSH